MGAKYILSSLVFGAVAFCCACNASEPVPKPDGDSFVFEMPEEKLRIRIPDIPQIQMGAHPLSGTRPDLRYMGEDQRSGYSISVVTPTADRETTPEDCASSSYKSLLKRFSLNPEFVSARKVSDSTFTVVFPYKQGSLIQLKAFILSGYGGDHCIDVHVSVNANMESEEKFKDQLSNWFQSFGTSSIEIY